MAAIEAKAEVEDIQKQETVLTARSKVNELAVELEKSPYRESFLDCSAAKVE